MTPHLLAVLQSLLKATVDNYVGAHAQGIYAMTLLYVWQKQLRSKSMNLLPVRTSDDVILGEIVFASTPVSIKQQL